MKKMPCGGFYYDDSTLAFTKDSNGNIVLRKKPIIQKVTDYLYYTEYDGYDYADGREYCEQFKLPSCSVVTKGNFVGRNLDWYYDENAQMVIVTKPSQGRHATIGVCNSHVTNEKCNAGDCGNYYNALPFMMSDCMNDVGVYANINVVNAGDKGLTKGTNPNGQDLCQIMIPRYVCDYADSAKHAIELLKQANIYAPLNKLNEEIHALIRDKNDVYIVEFIDNQINVLSSTDDDYDDIPNDKNIMTNFYMSGWDGDVKAVFMGNTEQDVASTGLAPHANGLERYKIIENIYGSLSAENDFIDAMSSVKYTKTYSKSTNPMWLSEFAEGDLTIYNNADDYNNIINDAVELFNHRDRKTALTWYTAHTSIYDLSNKKLTVFVGEDYDSKYEFKLNALGKI